jgi:HEAT repeat protein
MRVAVTGLLIMLLAGCGKPKTTLAGGKPVSHWLEAVHDPDPRVRKTAVFKLGNIGLGEADVLPSVTAALKDPDAAVRHEAILALVKFGAAAKEAAPILTEMHRRDRDAQVRSHAAKALESLERAK